jgi:hypothetical protein
MRQKHLSRPARQHADSTFAKRAFFLVEIARFVT